MRATDQSTAGVPFPPPLAFLATLGLGFALHLLFPLRLGRTTVLVDALEIAGTVLALAALVIAREERYLLLRFGAEYGAYCRSVRRWL